MQLMFNPFSDYFGCPINRCLCSLTEVAFLKFLPSFPVLGSWGAEEFENVLDLHPAPPIKDVQLAETLGLASVQLVWVLAFEAETISPQAAQLSSLLIANGPSRT